MNITQEKKGDLKAELKVTIEPDDYREKYNNALKEYRKRLNIPGFRQGKVPLGLVKSRYGKPLLAEEINKILNESISEYIQNNDLKILGSPMPVEDEKSSGDWENPDDFEFKYEMGLAPDFEIDLSKKLKLDFYKVEIDDELVDKQVNDIARRYGTLADVEEAGDKDMLIGDFVELDENDEIVPGGIMNNGTITMEFVSDEGTKANLIGVKPGQDMVVDPRKISSDEQDLARLLGVEQEQASKVNTHYLFKVREVKRLSPAELNQELFDKLYGEGEVSSEKELRERVKAELERAFQNDSERMFHRDMQIALLDKHDFDLPDEFLKRWIKANNEKPVSQEEVESNYEEYKKGLKWELIRNKIVEKHGIKVEATEAIAKTKSLIAQNYSQYGIPLPEDEELENSAKQVLSNQDEARRVFDMLYEEKISALVKEEAKVKDKEVSYDKFVDLANQA